MDFRGRLEALTNSHPLPSAHGSGSATPIDRSTCTRTAAAALDSTGKIKLAGLLMLGFGSPHRSAPPTISDERS